MPYGAGYAGCMYLGQLISGESEVTSANIAKGLDKLLTQVANNIASEGSNSSTILDHAIATLTGYSGIADFQAGFSGGDAVSVAFMRKLLNARGTNGAGSILGNLSDTEAALFAAPSGSYGSYNINKDNQWYSNAFGTGFTFPKNLPSHGSGSGQGNDRDGFIIQAGAADREEQRIPVKQFNISIESLFGGMEMDISTLNGARNTIALVEKADARISAVRSYYGGVQNRLEHTIANLDNIVENTTSAESLIRDTDMAKEMVEYTKTNILMQAGNAMLSQAMQTPQGVLQLLS
ncbi:MAG: flagellin [Lachnospiraceae bacterium]|nr:flagellin [Lachnospiraceae bacterium]